MIRGKAEPAKARNAKQNALIQSAARKNKPRFSALQSKLPPSFLSQKSVICMKFCAQAAMICKILKAFGPAVLHRATRAAKQDAQTNYARSEPRHDDVQRRILRRAQIRRRRQRIDGPANR